MEAVAEMPYDYLASFPDEMLLTIFIGLGLNLVDLLNVFAVCKRWNRLSSLLFARILAKAAPKQSLEIKDNSEAKDALFRYLKDLGRPITSQALMKKLYQAIDSGREHKARRFIEAGVDVNDKLTYGEYPIVLVSKKIHLHSTDLDVRFLHMLLSAGADEKNIKEDFARNPAVINALAAFNPTTYKREKSAILRGWNQILPRIRFLEKGDDSSQVSTLLFKDERKGPEDAWEKCEITGLPTFGEYSSDGDRLSGEWRCYYPSLISNKLCVGTKGQLYAIDLSPKKASAAKKYVAVEAGRVEMDYIRHEKYKVMDCPFKLPENAIFEPIEHARNDKPLKASGFTIEWKDPDTIEVGKKGEVVYSMYWDEELHSKPHFVAYGKSRLTLLIVSRYNLEVWKQSDS